MKQAVGNFVANTPDQTLRLLMDAGLKAADPYPATKKHLPAAPPGRLLVVAAGKAAIPMARAAAETYGNKAEGFILTPEGYGDNPTRFTLFQGTHPEPSHKNLSATREIKAAVESLAKGDLLLALISGGASALLCLPVGGITLEEKIKRTRELLASGLPIKEINQVRRSMSAVKGGKLAKAAEPADVATLVVSDVTGDDPAVVGSGPTVLRPGDATVVLKADDMLDAVAKEAEALGISVANLGGGVAGEVSEIAGAHARMALNSPEKRPHLILSGGETTVNVHRPGLGGRNTAYLLHLALALEGAEGIYALAADSDGLDGTGPHAGAILRSDTLADAADLGHDAEMYLKNNNSGGFFKAVNSLIVTGPTRTNLNDLRMILLV